MSDIATFRDFSRKRSRIYFAIDGEEFDARKALAPKRLQEAMLTFRATQENEEVTAETVMDKLKAALKLLLKEESYNRFVVIMDDDERDEPIDVPQLTDIFQWLIEQYSQRPTQALSDSSTSSETDSAGTDSPAGAQLQESIL